MSPKISTVRLSFFRYRIAILMAMLIGMIASPVNIALGDGLNGVEAATTVTFKSIGVQDGWILESGENTNAGGTKSNTVTILRLGDDNRRKQYLSILSFNTANLPDNAIIVKVTLRIKQQGIVGGVNPVIALQGFMTDIRKGTFGTSELKLADWNATANITLGPFTPSPNNGWYTLDLTSAKTYVNKKTTGSGLTQIRLRFQLNDNNNSDANILNLYSGNAGTAVRPQLIVRYNLP